MSLSTSQPIALPARLCTQLFVPGNRPERFDKACAAGADLVTIDLEDAVGVKDKDDTRKQVIEWLSKTKHRNVSLRINALDTSFGRADIETLAKSDLQLPYLMVPKVESQRDVDELDNLLPARLGPFFPIIESARGLLNSREIFSCDRVHLAMFGSVDFSADINCEISWDAHLYARSHLIACAASENVTLFDAPHINVQDLEDCMASTQQAKAIGLHARSAIHPKQLAVIQKALYPTETEISEAKKIIAAYDAANGNVVLLDGKFVEEPVIKKARKTLAFVQ